MAYCTEPPALYISAEAFDRNTRCELCGGPAAVATCDWPVKEWRKSWPDHVNAGDVFRFIRSKLQYELVENHQHSDTHRQLLARESSSYKPVVFLVPIYARVERLYAGRCNAWACESCHRDVGERHYCANHWHAWENV